MKAGAVKNGIIALSVMAGIALSASAIVCAENARDKEAEAQRMRERIKAAKKALENTEWDITLTRMTPSKKKSRMEDTIRFADGKIVSEMLERDGFSPTNFTVRIKGESTTIWETMQTSEKKGIAFWRGEVGPNGVMRGVLSWHVKENQVKDYSFISTGKRDLGPPAEEAAVEEQTEEVDIE